ncbi:mitochondrial phosphate carrier protein [Sorochytrium milnesiophthora]
MYPHVSTVQSLRGVVPLDKIYANAPGAPADKKPTGVDLYLRYAFAVDVVKTRIQLEPTVYNRGMLAAFRQVVAAEGAGALLTGFGPTAAGYFVQGAFKFGGYEFWKGQLINAVGIDKASDYRTGIYVVGAGLAEIAAATALCPLEATRIRLVSQPTFASGLFSGFARIMREEGVMRGFYSGIGPILFKQVPYTQAKFVVQELAAERLYNAIPTPKEQLSNSAVMSVNLGSGLIAGIAAAIISQPADTLLSKINKTKGAPGESTTSRLMKLASELGVRGLFLGLGARIVMVGTLTAGQFLINGEVKRMLGATGGYEIAKRPKAE